MPEALQAQPAKEGPRVRMSKDRGEITLHRMGPAVAVLGVIGVGAIGASFMTAASVAQKTSLLQSYFWAFIFWMFLTLGFFGLTLLHHTIRGNWGLPLLR